MNLGDELFQYYEESQAQFPEDGGWGELFWIFASYLLEKLGIEPLFPDEWH